MSINSLLRKSCGGILTRSRTLVVVTGALVSLSLPAVSLAQAQTACGPDVKAEVVKALASVEGAPQADKLEFEKQVYAKYQACAQDSELVPQSFFVAARQCGAAVSQLGSLFYEEMSCSGYDPQRRQFASPIKIKQTFGFGPAPLPGSREHVLHCVADANGVLLPVGRDTVHLADAIGDQNPTWQFAVIVSANENLHTIYPMDGQTRRARSILSWQLTPTDCNYKPIWGNALNYRIRLDQ